MNLRAPGASALCAAMLMMTLGTCGTSEGPSTSTSTSTSTTTSPSTEVEPRPNTGIDNGNDFAIGVVGGEVTPTPARHDIALGDEVTLRVTADLADEVHVHGYDVYAPTTPGETVVITFVADLAGVWEVELEGAKLKLIELAVQ